MAEIELTRVGPVGVITLNRPAKRNAMTAAMLDAMPGLVARLSADETIRAVVMTGAGADFCVGGDRDIARRMDEEEGFEAEAVAVHRRSIAALLDIRVPLIGAIEGAAIGFGAELVALCDLVVMGDTARLSDPHVLFGRAPGPVVLLAWPQQTSRLVAAELILTGREVPAEEAVSLGLANRVVPVGSAYAAALALGQAIAAAPPHGIAQSKRAMRLRIEDIDRLYPASK
jgi:enoyl-CoA hydratase